MALNDDRVAPLPDGRYDALVIDADDLPSAHGEVTAVEITITSGQHKGATLALTAPHRMGDPLDLIGLPATLTVAEGTPAVRIDR
jgi:ribosomal protein S28E/S33